MRDSPSAIIVGNGRMGSIHKSVYEQRRIPIKGIFDREDGEKWIDLISPGDFVSICSWDDAHARQICAALARDARVMAEKPICLHWGDLSRIQILLERRGRLACNFPLATDPFALQFLERGRTAYHLECDYNWGRARNLSGWRKDCACYSFVLGGGSHAIDLILRAKANPIFQVHAMGERVREEFPGYTMICVHGKFADGGTFRMNVNCAYDGDHFTQATAWNDDGDSKVTFTEVNKTSRIHQFIDDPDMDSSLIFDVHKVCFAIIRSLNSGKTEWV